MKLLILFVILAVFAGNCWPFSEGTHVFLPQWWLD